MNRECTIYRTADFVGKRWTLLILLELYKGRAKWKRYTRLKEKLPGITPKILSVRLKELADEGMVTKRIDAKKFPIKCEYSLTNSGEDFIKIIRDIKKWALRWKIKSKVCKNANCKSCRL